MSFCPMNFVFLFLSFSLMCHFLCYTFWTNTRRRHQNHFSKNCAYVSLTGNEAVIIFELTRCGANYWRSLFTIYLQTLLYMLYEPAPCLLATSVVALIMAALNICCHFFRIASCFWCYSVSDLMWREIHLYCFYCHIRTHAAISASAHSKIN